MGLGINPADESLIVATHNGSFRIPADSDDAERIGDSLQDTMGFTVVFGPITSSGPGILIWPAVVRASRHNWGSSSQPTAAPAGPASPSAARVDFHGLGAAHDLTYGWDAAPA